MKKQNATKSAYFIRRVIVVSRAQTICVTSEQSPIFIDQKLSEVTNINQYALPSRKIINIFITIKYCILVLITIHLRSNIVEVTYYSVYQGFNYEDIRVCIFSFFSLKQDECIMEYCVRTNCLTRDRLEKVQQ